MLMLQCAKIREKSKQFFGSTKKYVLALLLTRGRKNCSNMSSELGIKYKSIYEFFYDFDHQKRVIEEFLVTLVKLYSTDKNPGVLIVDTSQIQKLYAKKIECLCYDLNNSIKLVTKGISCVTAAWTNGKILIPLKFDFWVREKDLKGEKKYKKKTQISRELIFELKEKIPFAYCALDGDYGNEDFLKFLHEKDLYYSVRIPKNRKVLINGILSTLKGHPAFQLKRNERYKTVKGTYKGIPESVYFTVHKRKGKNGKKQIVFVISNLENLTPKGHVEAYNCRWPIEKMFRTMKQHLGLQQCQCPSEKKQRAHVLANFLAYAELEMQKISKKKKSPEQVLKILRGQNSFKKIPDLALAEGFIM